MSKQEASSNQPTEHEPRRLRADDCIVVDKKEIIKAQLGAGVGNFVEWYDIAIYGYLAITMTEVFTHGMDENLGLLVTLLGFAASFLVRPLGGIILGPLGDRIGRRKVLFFTIMLMAISTTLLGLLPTAEQVGLWVIVPLYLLKMLQGFSTGGEYSGAATYVAEFSPDRSRGVITSLLNSGSMLGFAAGAAVVAGTTALTTSWWGEGAMLDGGWRIPFLLALPLGIGAVALRSRVPESPGFEEAAEKEAQAEHADVIFNRQNLGGILRHYWPQILIGAALIAADSTTSYTLTSYIPTFAERQAGIATHHTALAATLILVVQAGLIPLFAWISDKIGRRAIYFMATIGNLVLLFPAFSLILVGEVWALWLGLFMISVPSAAFLAMTGVVMAELFPTASRYGGVGVTHNIAVSIFGGTTPLVSEAIVQGSGNPMSPALYVMFFSLVALFAAFRMRETAKRPLLGSVPVVSNRAEAEALEAGQDANEYLDTSTMILTLPDQVVKVKPKVKD
ncbi:MFS transporter [Gulosibacter sp. 10]|uniref:MFS transporter n=1 Tax=Gulosibacter sp. 10 TaxID=1255570 RepID=UPI00097F474F|nr:MFS transporter [Gulosibacter sp. 10]SJM64589.1 L-Proline/Glycine betaine transporter ProP [Gulosibacter sp. 10]